MIINKSFQNFTLLVIFQISTTFFYTAAGQTVTTNPILMQPAHLKTEVNPDTRLILTFPDNFKLHNEGQIRIYDATTDPIRHFREEAIVYGRY
ncbi:hypothetical protein [Sphingobacterium sp. FBM7-1]|uniref:hypothetical protein n=1 Tax=Sphingobacterium sp. FBM7-1 TaxID=2886688 RepID=UPI001D10173A|nr:hypothetical protein [Sphingobacterium sp. FBM7-1]MCC2598574.1 hypothetical protein [Sphingobacterium sp. FBM7-1]